MKTLLHLPAITRIQAVKVFSVLAMLVSIFIVLPVWMPDRLYPYCPFLNILPAIPSPYHYILLGAQVVVLLAILFAKRPRVFIISYVVLFAYLVLEDQNRLQPFFYQFVFMLLAIAMFKINEPVGRRRILDVLRIVVIGTYFWAGAQKLNPHFVNGVSAYMIEPFVEIPANWRSSPLRYFSLIVPLFEIAVAIGLMYNRWRHLAVVGVILTHVVALLIIGPLGHQWGFAVWPWNIAMILFTVVLFYTDESISFDSLIAGRKKWGVRIAILLFGFMPVLNFFGLWDYHLSFHMYSGRSPYAAIYIDQQLKENLPEHIQPYVYVDDRGQYIAVTEWAMTSLNQISYPQERVYRQVKDYVCTFSPTDSCHARLETYPYVLE